MREERVQHEWAQLSEPGRTRPNPDVSNVVNGTCRALANTLRLQRVDLSLQREADDQNTTALIRCAQDIAREWGLDSYVRFRADDLRLTFVKRTAR